MRLNLFFSACSRPDRFFIPFILFGIFYNSIIMMLLLFRFLTLLSILFYPFEKAYCFSVDLKWESKASRFLVEVKDPHGIITKTETLAPYLKLPILLPGKHQWRVRSFQGEKSSNFSPWATVQVNDAIINYESALMNSPPDESLHDIKIKGTKIELFFNRPVPNWEYTLEIYEDEELEVKETLKENSFKYEISNSVDVLKWRVSAQNSHSMKTKNKDFWTLKVLPLVNNKPVSKWFYNFSISNYTFKQRFSQSSKDSGSSTYLLQGHGIGHRYLAKGTFFHSVEGGLFYLLPVQFSDEFLSLNFETRAKFNLIQNLRFLGEYETSRISYKFKDRSEALQQTTFLGAGLETTLTLLSQKLTGVFILNQSFQAMEFLPSYKIRFHFEYSEFLRFNLKFALNKVEPDVDSTQAETTIKQFELGFSYFL